MKLHLMASFRTHFSLRDEEVLSSPKDYEDFWSRAADIAANLQTELGEVRFLHRADKQTSQSSRFRSVDTDSLLRPLHILEISIDPDDTLLETAWHNAKQKYAAHHSVIKKTALINESASVRMYNNSVALLQVDLDISDFIIEQSKSHMAEQLDALQEFGITFGEYLSQMIYVKHIKSYLEMLIKLCPHSDRFIAVRRFGYDSAHDNAILAEGSTRDNEVMRVNWVTRTILVEPEDNNNLEEVIGHWLKDCGHQETICKARKDPSACAIRWLNYLFREESYEWKRKADRTIDFTRPFADEWQAMLNAQYYYAAFEAFNDSLRSTLAYAYCDLKSNRGRNISALRELNHKLEQDVKAANLFTLEYHNNFGYYKRKVGKVMKEIMKGWDFDEAILNQVKRKTDLCEQRINELHQKAASRSGFYSDLLLLGIALVSVSAFLFQIIEYGRVMAHNADLAVYESNTWNLIELVSERPTDFVITLSLALIVVLFVLYAWFRRRKVMD